MTGVPTLPIVSTIGSLTYSRDQILAWEHRRARKVAARLNLPTDATVEDLRLRITDRKLELGHEVLEAMLKRDLALSELMTRPGALVFPRHRKRAIVELRCATGRAEHIPAWYQQLIATNTEAPLLAACPDHWISRSRPDGTQEITETTGGSPFATRMLVTDEGPAPELTPADPAFPVAWIDLARTPNGQPIGHIIHHFRDEPIGFSARLCIDFPAVIPPQMINAHRWHLACEFSNWIESANAASPLPV